MGRSAPSHEYCDRRQAGVVMATIERYERRSGDVRYRVRYRPPDRRQTDKRGFRTKREAEAFAATVETAILRGEYIADAAATVTLAELYTDWSRTRTRVKPSTLAKEESTWTTHVQSWWGAKRVADVRTSAVRAWIAELVEQGLKAATIEAALRVLRGILDLVVEDRRIQQNPCIRVKPPRREHSRRGYLTHDQVAALADTISVQPIARRGGTFVTTSRPEYGTIVTLLAYTGLRWGEMAALRAGDINIHRRRLDIRRAVAEVRGEMIFSTPKTHERRSVPFPAFLEDHIAKLIPDKRPDDLVFTGPNAAILRMSNFRPRIFLPAVHRCQKSDPTFPTISPHDLRHTAASLAISAGANVKAIQTMLGHKSAAMTLGTYADLFPDDLDDVASALDRAATRSRLTVRMPIRPAQHTAQRTDPGLSR